MDYSTGTNTGQNGSSHSATPGRPLGQRATTKIKCAILPSAANTKAVIFHAALTLSPRLPTHGRLTGDRTGEARGAKTFFILHLRRFLEGALNFRHLPRNR